MRILLLPLLLCTVFFCQAQEENKGELIDKVIAVVGNEIVLHSELEAQLEQFRAQGYPVNNDTRGNVLEDLLFQKLLLHQARLDSLEVSEAEIQAEIDRRLEYFVGMFGSIEEFTKYYGKSVAEWKAEFHDPIRDKQLVERMQQSISANVRSTPGDVQNYFNAIPTDSLPLINEELQYSWIMAKPEVRDGEKQRVRTLLDSIRTAVMTGKMSMTLAATRYSEDPGSKFKGGCYDKLRRGQFVPEYEAAVFTTPEGSFTPVFESDFGYHFVKVQEKRGEVYSSCHVLMKPKIYEEDLNRAQSTLDSAVAMLTRDTLNFKGAVLRYSNDEQTRYAGGKVVNPITGSTRHQSDELSTDLFFILNKMEPDEISVPTLLTEQDGTQRFVILKLDSRTPAHVADLSNDYQMFQMQAESELRNKATKKWILKHLSQTYIRLDDIYHNLKFEHEWIRSDS
jgi:peptidyl-prolyl cis-trans isomerase SurA